MNAKDASDPLAGLSRTQIFQLSRAENAPIHRLGCNWISQSSDNAFKGLVKKGLFTCFQSPKGHWIFHRLTPSGRALLPAIAEYFRADTEKQDAALAEIQRSDRIRDAAPELLALLESMNHMGGDERGGYCICPLNNGSAPYHKHATVCAAARALLAKAKGE